VKPIEVTPERVRSTAMLARLELHEQEVAAFVLQLQRVVDHMHDLDALDLTAVSVEAMSGECPMHNDVVAKGFSQSEALSQAPRSEAGAFVVPRFVEE
jgi:aspartyl-tRNA(Asn)/glutamyl-tRNA(Gln) amidotransferase subunit C